MQLTRKADQYSRAGVLGKYDLIMAMKSLEYEIKELTGYSKACCDCYELLKERIDKLCRFMTDEDNERQWNAYGGMEDVKEHAELLRESSVQALCDMEKYHSVRICKKKLDINGYISSLSDSVREELVRYRINYASQVLFIGSGALPLSAFIIARDAGASVLGLDIDNEAVQLAACLAEQLELSDKVRFTDSKVSELGDQLLGVTHVIIASLVKNKAELLDELKASIPPAAQVIVRYGNELKSVFNYPMEFNLDKMWLANRLPPCGALYDTVVLQRMASACGMQDRQA
jgi:hypothetical protein